MQSPEENVSVNDQGYLILGTYLSIILATMAESGEMLERTDVLKRCSCSYCTCHSVASLSTLVPFKWRKRDEVASKQWRHQGSMNPHWPPS